MRPEVPLLSDTIWGVHDAGASTSHVWTKTKALLATRRQRKWDSFSWLALRPVISSLNHTVNRFAPTLVTDLRREWVRRQAAGDGLIVDRSGDSSFIVLGDPGEQDASQYVVVPALQEQAGGADFMVVCSDVIYPSGDVNDYVDGLYVPYRGLAGLPILAVPGNHDWYDGLTGFMWHFCGADPLPATVYRPGKGTPLREWPFRLLWRRPSAPDPRLHLERLRAEQAPDGQWSPLQPGPYYAVQTRHVLLVCIDTGIDRRLDHEQGEWLCRISMRPGAKVLLTGVPLVANRERQSCPIAGGPVGYRHGPKFQSVADIVEHEAHGYVATIGGDIHNFQHYRIGGRHHIVAGGGGAYMTATHPIPVTVQDPCTAEPDAPPAEQMFPSAPESLRHFARQLLPRVWRLVRALIAVLAGVVAGIGAVEWAGDGTLPPALPRQAVGLAPWLLAGAVAVRMLLMPAAWARTGAYRAGVVLVAYLTGVTVVRATWWLAPQDYLDYLLAWMALTAAGAIVAWLLRLTGWWRPRSARFLLPGQRESPRWLLVLATGLALLPVAVWLVGHDWWLTGAAALTAVAAIGGWPLRWTRHPPGPRCSWRRIAPPIIYGVQVLDALVVLARLVAAGSPWIVLGLAAGLLAVCAAAAGAVLLLSTLLPLGLARAGLVFPLGAAGIWVLWACCGGDSPGQRAALITAIVAGGLIVTVFAVDAMRRRLGPPYKIVAVLLAAAGGAALLYLGAFNAWIPGAAVTAVVVLAMTVITVVTLHLTFLGAFSLIWDRDAHHVGEQLTWIDADRVIRWRAGGSRPPERQVRRRANIVFPGADQPRGPIQAAVSELFDSDEPPFIKSFLVVKSAPRRLTVTAHVVTGTDTGPGPYEIKIPLPVNDPDLARADGQPAGPRHR